MQRLKHTNRIVTQLQSAISFTVKTNSHGDSDIMVEALSSLVARVVARVEGRVSHGFRRRKVLNNFFY
jgi:hypothetical protein